MTKKSIPILLLVAFILCGRDVALVINGKIMEGESVPAGLFIRPAIS